MTAKAPTELLYGTLDLLVLKTLTWDAMHGYAITEWLERRTGGTLTIDDAALYKSLHRLEERGDLSSAWGYSENNRRAKFYALTAAGRRRLRTDAAAWTEFARAVHHVLQAAS